VAAHSRDFVILTGTVFIELQQGVTNERTKKNKQTDAFTITKMRLAKLSRIKSNIFSRFSSIEVKCKK